MWGLPAPCAHALRVPVFSGSLILKTGHCAPSTLLRCSSLQKISKNPSFEKKIHESVTAFLSSTIQLQVTL